MQNDLNEAEFHDILRKQAIEKALKDLKSVNPAKNSLNIGEIGNVDQNKTTPILKAKFEDTELIEKTSGIGEKIHQDLSKQSLDLINKIYHNWEDREKDESTQRKSLTDIVIKILMWQVGLNFVFLIMLGIGFLKIDTAIVVTYFTAFVAELIGIVIVVMKYFYDERTVEPLKIIKDVLVSISRNNTEFNQKSDSKDKQKGSR